MTTKIVMTCKHCGGTKVTRDSVSRWSVEDQRWEQTTVFDNADCDDCGGEATLVETPLADLQAAYMAALVRLWDFLSDTIEGGRLTEADCPDDYQAFVTQMIACERARDAAKV